MNAFAVSVLAFVSTTLLVWAGWRVFGTGENQAKRRIRDVLSPSGRSTPGDQSGWLQRATTRWTQWGLFKVLMRLLLVKWPEGAPIARAPVQQALAFLSFLGVGILMGWVVWRMWLYSAPAIFQAIGVLVVLWSTAVIVARMWVTRYTNRWLEQIKNGLINVLDLWVLCLGSGMGFPSALVRVTQEPTLTNSALREQLLLTNQELFAGASREDALRHLVRRCGNLPEVSSLVSHILHAERLGGSLVQTLRVYAQSLRFKRTQDEKERIQKLQAWLVIPLVLFIFPAILIIFAGPGLLSLYRAFASF